MNTCPFCIPNREVRFSNEAAIAVLDNFPVSPAHMLVIPKKHVPLLTELSQQDYRLCFDLTRLVVQRLMEETKADGVNIGVNCGEAAGQTVMHTHIHIIPRYEGDVEDPRGGVRGVIPAKQRY